MVYGGPVTGAVDYFQSLPPPLALKIPLCQNPADWIVDITSIED
jgi:hypothetical protein